MSAAHNTTLFHRTVSVAGEGTRGLVTRDGSQYDKGDVAFIALCGVLVFFMVPGVAFLYSGLSRRKSALSLVWAVAASNAVAIFQWWFWGYSLAFSPTATNGFIGDLRSFALRKVLGDPSPGSPLIPEILYSFFQMEFACVTVAILMGALAERGRVFPAVVFSFVWLTIVYCPIAYWVWGPAVGVQVGRFRLCWRRTGGDWERIFRPGVFLGLGPPQRTGATEFPSAQRLHAATPASGYIPQWAAVIMGIVVGVFANYGTKVKYLLRIDDALDLCAEHAIGGIVGLLFCGLFGDSEIIALDGINTSANGGWLNHNWKQLYIQFAYVCAVVGYSFVMTAFLAKVTDYIPTLHLRASPEAEMLGMDDAEIGEFASDYIEVRRDYTDWTPPYAHKGDSDSETPTAAGDRHALPDTSISTQEVTESPSNGLAEKAAGWRASCAHRES
ncbi:Ammonium transporter 2 [Grifola frondosa]|uniref:Ammonium transporter 2 n=1 Tax=Grifola frondosa TaxID=5627 RepID=A0A1C7MTF4_GRIFR|nr:Ammonium transporter 2 [Grifola frondosa]